MNSVWKFHREDQIRYHHIARARFHKHPDTKTSKYHTASFGALIICTLNSMAILWSLPLVHDVCRLRKPYYFWHSKNKLPIVKHFNLNCSKLLLGLDEVLIKPTIEALPLVASSLFVSLSENEKPRCKLCTDD